MFCVVIGLKSLSELGGTSLLQKYNNSLPALLSTMFPGFEWLPWKFFKCPQNYWDDMKNQRKFMDWVVLELKIKEPKDWYTVSSKVYSVFIVPGTKKSTGLDGSWGNSVTKEI